MYLLIYLYLFILKYIISVAVITTLRTLYYEFGQVCDGPHIIIDFDLTTSLVKRLAYTTDDQDVLGSLPMSPTDI